VQTCLPLSPVQERRKARANRIRAFVTGIVLLVLVFIAAGIAATG
jgi:hypothetical protein